MDRHRDSGSPATGQSGAKARSESGMPLESQRASLDHALQRILWELRPYLSDLVVIGGWVPYLYQRYGVLSGWSGPLSLTAEVDILVDPEMPPGGRQPIAGILRDAGFQPVGKSRPVAVWANEPARGEKIEFLVQHSGARKSLGTIVPLRAQEGLGAIALARLDILRENTSTLLVPARSPGDEIERIALRVPQLGAYVLNKAATFMDRPSVSGTVGNPKRAKDLLYLRDVLHAGPALRATIANEISQMVEADPRVRYMADKGADNLDRIVSSGGNTTLDDVGAMLAEREPERSRDGAVASVLGHLMDLRDLLDSYRSPPATGDSPEDE